jgi:hypothetical protein
MLPLHQQLLQLRLLLQQLAVQGLGPLQALPLLLLRHHQQLACAASTFLPRR